MSSCARPGSSTPSTCRRSLSRSERSRTGSTTPRCAPGRMARHGGATRSSCSSMSRPYGPWEPYAPGVNGNTAADFVAMWRHFHDIATRAGADNVTWVWCPNIDTWNKFTPYRRLYPGKRYVNWTCLDGYNKAGAVRLRTVFKPSYRKLRHLAPRKRIMIGQTASVEGGDGKAAWIRKALSSRSVRRFPAVRPSLFNSANLRTGQVVGVADRIFRLGDSRVSRPNRRSLFCSRRAAREIPSPHSYQGSLTAPA